VCVGGGSWSVTSLFSKWAASFCHVRLQVIVSKLRDLCQWICMPSLLKISMSHCAFGIIWHVLSLRVFLSFEEPCTYTKRHTSNYSILIMKANEMHCFSNLFAKVLCMFWTSPLSIIRSISTLYTQQYMLADANRTSMKHTYCVYTVLIYSWWWTVNLSETCRVLYQINMRESASCWLSL
jgi:hypothetical protein